MATKKVTGIPEVDAMLAKLNKQFEKELLSEEPFNLIGVFSTGAASLDAALQVGGMPKGIVAEILGESQSGKTSLCLQMLASAQQTRKAAGDFETLDAIVDMERTITEEFMLGFGIDIDKVLHFRPDNVEEALQIMRDLPKTGKFGVMILDSVGALETAKKQQKNIGEVEVASIAKLMHEALRSISKIAADTGTTFLFINHITYKIGVLFGSPETSPGGQALPYYSSVRFKLLSNIPSPTDPGACTMRVRIIKNKCGPPFGKDLIEFVFFYGRGVDPIAEVLEMARTLGYLRHSAGQSKICLDLETPEWIAPGADLPKGKDACFAWYRSHPNELQILRDLVLQHS
mgnify:CR=1 FL=1